MRTLLVTLLLAAAPAWADVPAMRTVSQGDVKIDVPAEWKAMVDPGGASVQANLNAWTNITLHWYPYGGKRSPDDLLDILLRVTNENLPVGEAEELSRATLPDNPGKILLADYSNFVGSKMRLAFVVWVDDDKQRVVTGVWLSDPKAFEELAADRTIVAVARSLSGGGRGPGDPGSREPVAPKLATQASMGAAIADESKGADAEPAAGETPPSDEAPAPSP